MFGRIFSKKFLAVASFIAFVLPACASANIIISEIMYDLAGSDSGREWVEIYNNGSSPVTVVAGGSGTAWKFSDGSQHSIASVRGDSILNPGEYAVIADSVLRFMADNPTYSGDLFDSSFSLNNILGNLSILSKKDGLALNNASYSSSLGASGDGNSLQIQEDGRWIGSAPTPGYKNSSVAFVANDSSRDSNASNLSAHYSAIPTSSSVSPVTLGVGAGRQRVGAVGSPMEFKVETNIDQTKYNNFRWNFGDGSEGGGSVLNHTYMYPGDYVVILNASFFGKGEAVARVDVKIVDPQLAVTHADAERIELRNGSVYEVSLFGRALVVGDDFFVFSKDTIIGSGQIISFASNITGLNPKETYEVYIAVLGDAEHQQFAAKIQDEKSRQISYIKDKILTLQKKVQELLTKDSE